jgi:hypothetical protein
MTVAIWAFGPTARRSYSVRMLHKVSCSKRSCLDCKADISPHMFSLTPCRYAPQPSHTGSRREAFFNSTLVELQNWLYDLPDTLRLDVGGRANTFPQAHTLHMTFHTAIILLANGTIASKARGTSSDAGEAKLLDKKASCICYEAATNMCNVAKTYRRTFGGFYLSAVSATHCLLSAALVLMQVASTEYESPCRRAAAANVDLCLQSLKELSVSWKIADKTHRNLALLKERRLGPEGRAREALPLAQSQASTLHTDHLLHSIPIDLTNFTGYSLTNSTLFSDTDSLLDPYSSGDSANSGFDFAAQLADIDLQDQLLWGSFNEELTSGQGF